jgi:glycosyltransferase involved in cell wall biosynthesis
VVAELERRSPGGFSLSVIGAEKAGPGQEWYQRVVVPDPCKPYPNFVRWLRGLRDQFDVAVAPLRDDEFNRCKSDLKYLEYAALGLPAVFSDCEPYASVEDGRTGLKAAGDEAWVAALTRLRDEPALADELADSAFAYVVEQRLMRGGAERLLELVLSAISGDERREPSDRAEGPPLSLLTA